MKKILLTGFEPFQKEEINPSKILVQEFARTNGVDTLVLPVSYERAVKELQVQMGSENYDFVLMLGQGGGRKWIDLERVAINLQDSEKPDEDSDLRVQHKISLEGPDAFLNPLPLRDWVQLLQQKKLPVEISFSAGAYVCNTIYYHAFQMIKASKKDTQALFIHLPYIQEQLAGKPEETPFLPISIMKKAIEEILGLIQNLK